MTTTWYRKQTTLTFLAERLVSVEWELAQLLPQEQGRQRKLETRGDALRETIAQFDPELSAIPNATPGSADT